MILCPICGEEINNIPKDIEETEEDYTTLTDWYEDELICENCEANLTQWSEHTESHEEEWEKEYLDEIEEIHYYYGEY